MLGGHPRLLEYYVTALSRAYCPLLSADPAEFVLEGFKQFFATSGLYDNPKEWWTLLSSCWATSLGRFPELQSVLHSKVGMYIPLINFFVL